MTKVVFQIGILAFCVSAVLFGTQGLSLFAIVARSFMVFMAVVTAQVVIVVVAANMQRKSQLNQGAQTPQMGEVTPEPTVTASTHAPEKAA